MVDQFKFIGGKASAPLKSLFMGSAAFLAAASGAQAADEIVAPEPESVEYVRVCDAYGAGYFYIPGTETCLRVGGYIRYDVFSGGEAYTGFDRKGWDKFGRFALQTSALSETDLGTLQAYAEIRFNYASNNSGEDGENGSTSSYVDFENVYIQLGGFEVGIDDTMFKALTGGIGDVINDTVINPGHGPTGRISYTYKAANGFSAGVSLEQGSDGEYIIDGYVPHVVGGLKYKGDSGSIAGVVGYDSVIEGWAAKVRGDVIINDRLSAWVQGAYSSDETNEQNFGRWGGDWAAWGGFKLHVTKQATLNLQAAYEDWGKTAITTNVAYEIVPGFAITPEISYTQWEKDHADRVAGDVGADALQGTLRFQRSF